MTKDRSVDDYVLITEEELLNSSADRVYDWFKFRGEKDGVITFSEALDDEVELKLLDRGDRLIDLAIAKYGVHIEAISKVFNKALDDKNQPVILACLGNLTISKVENRSTTGLPYRLIEDEDKRKSWFSNISKKEIYTLFSNPTISDAFLENFLNGDDYWNLLDDSKREYAVYSLSNNKRMIGEKKDSRRRYIKDFDDGYRDFKYRTVFHEAWRLAEKVPLTKNWATTLATLFEKMPDETFKFKSEEVAKRWLLEDDEEDKNKLKMWPNPFEEIRISLYDLTTKENNEKYGGNKIYLDDKDIARRISAYKKLRLNVEEMREAYNRDKILAVSGFLDNICVWVDENKRDVLHELCVDVDKIYDYPFDGVERYNFLEEYYRKNTPEWFYPDHIKTSIDDSLPVNIGILKENLAILQDSAFNKNVDLMKEIFRIEKESKKRMEILLAITGCILFVILWKLL
jgi:hypothetical protein